MDGKGKDEGGKGAEEVGKKNAKQNGELLVCGLYVRLFLVCCLGSSGTIFLAFRAHFALLVFFLLPPEGSRAS